MPLYIEKVEIWSGDTNASLTHKLTDFEQQSYLAPQKYAWSSRNPISEMCLHRQSLDWEMFESLNRPDPPAYGKHSFDEDNKIPSL